MRLFLAVFFTFVTLTESASAAESIVTEKKHTHELVQSADSAIPSLIKFEKSDDNSCDHPCADCEHSCPACHNCHLGHCAFPISRIVSILTLTPQSSLPMSRILGFIFNFHTSLFRPPIS